MTRLNNVDESAKALVRVLVSVAHPFAVHARGQAAVRDAPKLLSDINGKGLNEVGRYG